jgi:hypothetical protein
MKKVSTEAAKQSRKISEQKLTVRPSPILTDRSRNAVGHCYSPHGDRVGMYEPGQLR